MDAPPPTVGAIREFLETRLPRHMVPGTYTFLDALPLTPNGKVNRRALPPPAGTRPDGGESFEAPHTATEEAVACIWRDVLALKQIGVRDNFFDLGGHSLLMTQVIARIRGAFQIELPMRRFFEGPTVGGQATVIEELLIEEVDRLSEQEAQQLVRSNP